MCQGNIFQMLQNKLMGQIGTSEKTETKNHIVLSDNHSENLISWRRHKNIYTTR